MHIGILIASQTFEDFTGWERLEEVGIKAGHTVTRLFERKTSFQEAVPPLLKGGVGGVDGALTVTHDNKPMPAVDVIIVRPNFVEEPSIHQYVYDLLLLAGYKLVNGGGGITRTKNKILQRADLVKAGVSMPRWSVVYDIYAAEAAAETLGYPVMLKMAFGTKGKGVFFADKKETLLPIVDYLSVRDGNPVIVEEFIEEAKRSDIRVFIVGEKIIAAMEIVACEGEVRSNAGGAGRVVDLTDEERLIALKATQVMGLHIAGVDLLRSKRGPLIMEVNANPGFRELERVTGVDVAGAIVDFAVRMIN